VLSAPAVKAKGCRIPSAYFSESSSSAHCIGSAARSNGSARPRRPAASHRLPEEGRLGAPTDRAVQNDRTRLIRSSGRRPGERGRRRLQALAPRQSRSQCRWLRRSRRSRPTSCSVALTACWITKLRVRDAERGVDGGARWFWHAIWAALAALLVGLERSREAIPVST